MPCPGRSIGLASRSCTEASLSSPDFSGCANFDLQTLAGQPINTATEGLSAVGKLGDIIDGRGPALSPVDALAAVTVLQSALVVTPINASVMQAVVDAISEVWV